MLGPIEAHITPDNRHYSIDNPFHNILANNFIKKCHVVGPTQCMTIILKWAERYISGWLFERSRGNSIILLSWSY